MEKWRRGETALMPAREEVREERRWVRETRDWHTPCGEEESVKERGSLSWSLSGSQGVRRHVRGLHGQDNHLKPVLLILGPRLGFEQFVQHLDIKVNQGTSTGISRRSNNVDLLRSDYNDGIGPSTADGHV